jgi:hypothetical protein
MGAPEYWVSALKICPINCVRRYDRIALIVSRWYEQTHNFRFCLPAPPHQALLRNCDIGPAFRNDLSS